MTNALQKTFAATIADKITVFDASSKQTETHLLNLLNAAREIGLLVDEWSQGELSISFVANNPIGQSFERLKQFKSIAARMPEPVTNITDCRALFQLTFATAGLVELPESSAPQHAISTPFTMFTSRISSLRECITKLGSTGDRAAVKEQLRPIVEFYQTL